MKKIVVIQPLLAAKRGPWRFINEISKRLRLRDYLVSVYCLAYERSSTFDFDYTKKEVAGGKLRRNILYLATKIWKKLTKFQLCRVPLSSFVSPFLMLVALVKEKPDIILVNEGATFCGLLKTLCPKLSIIIYYHKPSPDTAADTLLARFLRPFEILSAKNCIVATNSTYFAHKLANLLRVRPHVIHPGVYIERFSRLPRSDDGKTLLYVAAFSPEKLQNFLIVEIIDRLLQRGVQAKLILAGSLSVKDESRRYYEKILQKISELKLQSAVTVYLNIDDKSLLSIYSKASVYLHPAIEGFGISIVEAMAAGLPVICRNEGGQLDIVRPRIDGLAVGENVEEWCSAIIKLLTDRQLRERMSKVARERAKDFSWEKTVEKLEQLFYG
jgi:glycosyltransferase involved in cell wall biosynthesis